MDPAALETPKASIDRVDAMPVQDQEPGGVLVARVAAGKGGADIASAGGFSGQNHSGVSDQGLLSQPQSACHPKALGFRGVFANSVDPIPKMQCGMRRDCKILLKTLRFPCSFVRHAA